MYASEMALGTGKSRCSSQGVPSGNLALSSFWLLIGMLSSWPAVASPEVKSPAEWESASNAGGSSLHIDVDPAIADAKLFPIWIRERNSGLEERIPKVPGRRHWIVVQIEGVTYKYRVRISAMRDGKRIGSVSDVFSCDCNSGVLLDVIDEGIAQAIERFEMSGSMVSSGSSSGRHRGQVDAKEDLADDIHRPRLGAPGYAGLGVGMLGVGVLATGAQLMLHPSIVKGRPGQLRIASYRTPGVVLAAVGGAGLMAGVILVAIDVARRRARQSLVVPVVTSRFAGFSLRHEF